jgi:hypothetical protein
MMAAVGPGDLHTFGVTLQLYPVLMDLPKLRSQLRLPDDSLV